MICKKISRRKDRSSKDYGLSARIFYILANAVEAACQLILSGPAKAAAQMDQTRILHRRDAKGAFVHFIISWPVGETPTNSHAFDAGRYVLRALGAGGHEAVMGIHQDTGNTHLHILVSRIDPTNGALLDFWQDYAIVEKSCRELELRQGWSQDNGRFDIHLSQGSEGPVVTLVQKSRTHWIAKVAARALGRTAPSREVDARRSTGLPTVQDRLPDWVLDAVRTVLSEARDWQSVSLSLARFGLSYGASARGAVIGLSGTNDVTAAGRYGAAFTLKRMESRLGPMPDAADFPYPTPNWRDLTLEMSGERSVRGFWLSKSKAFSIMTASRLHAAILAVPREMRDEVVAFNLGRSEPTILLRDSGWIVDQGDRVISGGGGSWKFKSWLMTEMGIAKRWARLEVRGLPVAAKHLMLQAAKSGIKVVDQSGTLNRALQMRFQEAAISPESDRLRMIDGLVESELVDRERQRLRNETQTRQNHGIRARKKREDREFLASVSDGLRQLPARLSKLMVATLKSIFSQRYVEIADLRRVTSPLSSVNFLRQARDWTRPEHCTGLQITLNRVTEEKEVGAAGINETIIPKPVGPPENVRPPLQKVLITPRTDLPLLAFLKSQKATETQGNESTPDAGSTFEVGHGTTAVMAQHLDIRYSADAVAPNILPQTLQSLRELVEPVDLAAEPSPIAPKREPDRTSETFSTAAVPTTPVDKSESVEPPDETDDGFTPF